MPIRIYEPTEPLPSKGPLAMPVQDDSWKQFFLMTEAITDLGQMVVSQVAETRYKSEIDNAETQLNSWFLDFKGRMENEPVETVKEQFETEREQIKESITGQMKMKRARHAFTNAFTRSMDAYGFELQSAVNKRTVAESRVHKVNNIRYWSEQGDIGKVDEIMSDPTTRSLFQPEEIAKLYEAARNRTAYNTLRRYAMGTDFETATKALQNRDTVNTLLESNGLRRTDIDDDQVEGLLKDVVTQQNIAEDVIRQKKQADFEVANETLWDTFIKNPALVTDQLIDSQSIPVQGAGGKDWWRNQRYEYYQRQKALAAQGAKDFITDPAKEAELQRMIRNPEFKDAAVMTYFESIANGRGLSNEDSNKYYEKIKGRRPNILVKEGLDAINAEIGQAIKDAQAKGNKEAATTFSLDRVKVMNLFSEWYDLNKDKVTPGQVTDYVEELLEPYKRGKVKKMYKDVQALGGRPAEAESIGLPGEGTAQAAPPQTAPPRAVPPVAAPQSPKSATTGAAPKSLETRKGVDQLYLESFGTPPSGRLMQYSVIDEKTKKAYTIVSPDNGNTWYRNVDGKWETSTQKKPKWSRVK